MADFTITIGPVTSAAITVDSAKALTVVRSYLDAYGLDSSGTNQQLLDLFAAHIKQHAVEAAHGQQKRESQAADLVDYEANKEGME